MEKTINSERSLTLDFTEENLPDWQPGTKLPNPYEHHDGDRYIFSGTAAVEEILHRVGAAVTVKITHYPEIG